MRTDCIENKALRRVGLGLTVGGTVTLVALVAKQFFGKQRSIYLKVGIPLAVVSGTLAGVFTSRREVIVEEKKEEGPPPERKRIKRKLFEGNTPVKLPPRHDFALTFSPQQLKQQPPPVQERCNIF